MNLNTNLKLVDVNKYNINKGLNNKHIEHTFRYTLSPNANYEIVLYTAMTVEAYLKNYSSEVVNFGYSLDISSTQNDVFEYAIQDGRMSKKYIKDTHSRQIITKFVAKSLDNMLRTLPSGVFMRGPLDPFKQNSDRYRMLDKIIFKHGYKKLVIPISSMKGDLPMESLITTDKDVYWFYVKPHIDTSLLYNLKGA